MTLTFNGCLVAENPPSVDTRKDSGRPYREDMRRKFCLPFPAYPRSQDDVCQPLVCALWKGCKQILVTGGPRTPVVNQRQVPNSAVEWVRTCVV